MGFWTFLREFARTPSAVGSIAPSSRYLARRMIDAAEVRAEDVVVEIGAGTGPFTAELLRRFPALTLLALEPSADLAAALRQRFPGLRVEEELAQDLPALVEAWGHTEVDRVISGLPWTMWPEEVIAAGLDAVVEVLRPGGRMVTFSYVHSQALLPGAKVFRRLLEERFETVRRTQVEWRNAPPALVFVCDAPSGGAEDA